MAILLVHYCFDDINCIIFCTAILAFQEKTKEEQLIWKFGRSLRKNGARTKGQAGEYY